MAQPSSIAEAGIKAGYLTSRQRAEAVGCSRYYLLKLEWGALRPSPLVVKKMARAYRIPVDDLLDKFRKTRRDWLNRELKAI